MKSSLKNRHFSVVVVFVFLCVCLFFFFFVVVFFIQHCIKTSRGNALNSLT